MTLSRAAELLRDLQPGRCRWPSRHDLTDERFTWCGDPVGTVGAPYCAEHARRSRGEDTAPLDETIEVADRTYRMLIRDRTKGALRRWVERVPSGTAAPQGSAPDSVVEVGPGIRSLQVVTRTDGARNRPSGEVLDATE